MSAIEAISVEPQQGLAVVGYTFLATCRLCGGSVAHEAIKRGPRRNDGLHGEVLGVRSRERLTAKGVRSDASVVHRVWNRLWRSAGNGTEMHGRGAELAGAGLRYRVEAFVVEQPKRKQVRAPRVWGRVIHTGRAVRVLDSDSEGFRVRFPGSKKVHWMGPDDVQILSDEEGAAA